MTGVTAMMAAGAHSSALGRATVNIIINATRTNYVLNPANAGAFGYIPGRSDINFIVDTGVYLYSESTSAAALIVEAFAQGDIVTIINSGYILGMGGAGATGSPNAQTIAATAGGAAISLGFNILLTNNSYIAGGGGGGGSPAGGGGAGGGAGGGFVDNFGTVIGTGGAGGGPGSAGSNGTAVSPGASGGSGAGGGLILPGAGGAGAIGVADGFVGETQAQGGGAGGGAGAITAQISRGTLRTSTGGGGGGWGAAGGAGQQKTTGPEYSTNIVSGSGGGSNSAGSNGTVAGAGTPTDYSGAAGGKAINLNGYTVTYLTTGTVWGAVS